MALTTAEEKRATVVARRFAWGLGLTAVALACFAAKTGASWRDAPHVASGDKIPTEAYMHWGLWWASVANAVLCAALAMTARWWARAGGHPSNDATSVRVSRLEWLFLAGVLLAAGGLRWGRMDLSLYNDEAHTFRRYIAGSFKETKSGGTKWRQVKWEETFFLNQVGNNSMPCSVLGRLCYDAWKGLSKAPDGDMNETALRLPSLAAGLGSIAVLWLLLRRLMPGTSCWWAAGLAALHPWHVRYSTEARGYALMLLGVTACFYFIQRAMEDGRWRWWFGLALSQFTAVWAFPGAVYFLVALNLGLLGMLTLKAGKTRDWRPVLAAAVSMLAGGMMTLQVMLPTAPQIVAAMKILDSVKGAMGWVWWRDIAGGLLHGMRWVDGDGENPWNVAVGRELGAHPWLYIPVLWALAAWVWGTLSLARRGGVAALVAWTGPAAILLSWALMIRDAKFLHYWYVIYALPGVLAALASVGSLVHSTRRAAGRGLLIVLFLTVGGFWAWADGRYLQRSKENMKELVPLARGGAFPEYLRNPNHPLLGAVFSDIDVYDPHVRIIKTTEDLDDMENEAKLTGRELFVTYGRLGLMDLYEKELIARLNDPQEFRRLTTSYGLEEQQFSHFLMKYMGAKPETAGAK